MRNGQRERKSDSLDYTLNCYSPNKTGVDLELHGNWAKL